MTTAAVRVHHVMDTASLLWSLDAELTPARGGPSLVLCLLPPTVAFFASLADLISSATEDIDNSVSDTFMYTSYYISSIAGTLVEAQFCAACLALRFWLWNLNCRIQVSTNNIFHNFFILIGREIISYLY